ncbi:MAG: glycosyltransferase family 2 protein [Hyphomicrobiaceae bacterium]|nr:MAG: glycosyltransferase family 2 protein [Hyphomicrobiaceae bacterium]
MSLVDDVTVMVITYNEEANIARTLEAVNWAKRILVVDSGSTDATLEIVSRFPQANFITRPFDGFAEQCNFGLGHVSSPWVLSMDADYEVSRELRAEIAALVPPAGVAGYLAPFVYRIYGRSLRSTLYPPRAVLYRRDRARYRNEGHGHRVEVQGDVRRLSAPIYHDDRKPLSRWISSQQRYAQKEAEHLLNSPRSDLRRSDRIRLMAWPAPLLVFFYTLIIKRCLLDGRAGWYYVLQRTIAECLIAIEIIDRRLFSRNASSS